MNYCTYRIKEKNKNCWHHCQLEEGHGGDHKPPYPNVVFEGNWFRPGEKETADPQPMIPFVGHNADVKEKSRA